MSQVAEDAEFSRAAPRSSADGGSLRREKDKYQTELDGMGEVKRKGWYKPDEIRSWRGARGRPLTPLSCLSRPGRDGELQRAEANLLEELGRRTIDVPLEEDALMMGACCAREE